MSTDSTNTTDAPAARPLAYEVSGTISVPVVDKTGASVGSIDIDPTEFSKSGEINRQLMHEVVLMHLANKRAGTHSTLRRGQVAGSTKKLFRQKGTGNARAGTKRTNKRKGGGTAKGPKPRDYEYHLPRKAVQAATRMAILTKFADREAVIVDDLTGPEQPKTKAVTGVLAAIKLGDAPLVDQTVLIGTATRDENLYLSARNLPNVEVQPASEFNCYTVLRQKRLVLTRGALEYLRKKAAGTLETPEPEPTPEKVFPKKLKRTKAARLAKKAKREKAAAK